MGGEPAPPAARGPGPGGWLAGLCRGFAIAGGVLILAAAALTVVSVGTRYVLGRPIPGDFELVEIACAVAVFAFLPWCQLQRGNVLVDVFTLRAPRRLRARLDALWSALYGALALLLAWRMALGGLDMRRYGEQTMVLGVPLWWGFIPIVASLLLLAATCLATAWHDLRGGSR
ncbi:TRAP transporter small permease [Inmirania thermothiophila]|uniref:TRAP transporter small permease protein n=1 Tax=Inmirania thermothiophila TaxID=1750597 RepID=A0A3N1Y022_9GAMM|nr:TRAP transporter small permease subunit [Inmirania thermothiophila]ROR32195.1 TRAP-type C4-dicarboxylate transport system permease small subunit [Inmirania thermothiophila]